ncbi:MAG: diguanylate cyclase [Clostridia bacterium]|nr:diguanylate cyclase [Clostridia bacterium]
MHSIKAKITVMTAAFMVIAMTVATVFGISAIRRIGSRSANQILLLLCETGEKNLDHYFESVEQSVDMVSAYVESDLDGVDDAHLQAHLDRVSEIFNKLTYKTNGVLTYYYRIDPTVSENVKGFWYVNLNDEGFKQHEVTDISKYDTSDTSGLVWFTVPKSTGTSVWLPPYITDNLNVRVISYNVPVSYKGRFIGVIGIEIDYSTMADEVNHITLYENGYAFLNDEKGNIIYHPHIDVTALKTQPKVPDGLLSDRKNIHYNYDGVEKQAVWLPLSNGMRLNVTVPVNEINAEWQNWSIGITIAFVAMLVVFILILRRFVGRITKPLRQLTAVAEQVDAGNYDCRLDYDGRDEVGTLTRTFNRLTENLKAYIRDLNDLAYADALTSLHNKGAFDICIKNIQTQIDKPNGTLEFAVCIFDCNDLKKVNDNNGHDKGDIYLKDAANTICEVFEHSPVFRIGGDEFAALLLERDYRDRDELLKLFDERCREKRKSETDAWERVDVARGIAVYNPNEDGSVDDVVRRADKNMYEYKWSIKEKRLKSQEDN